MYEDFVMLFRIAIVKEDRMTKDFALAMCKPGHFEGSIFQVMAEL